MKKKIFEVSNVKYEKAYLEAEDYEDAKIKYKKKYPGDKIYDVSYYKRG